MKLRIVAALSVALLAGCNGAAITPAAGVGPATSTGVPFPVNDDEVETPNALPPGFTTVDPMAPGTGVIGVTHQAP